LNELFESELEKKQSENLPDRDMKIVKSMSLYKDSIETFRNVVETHKTHRDFRLSFADIFRELVENEREQLEKLHGKLEQAPSPKAGRR
jgi:uncharacterized FlgJ-related protein